MVRRARWLWGSLLVLLAMAGVLALAVAWMVPSDRQLADRLAAQAQDRLGVPVVIGAVHWELFPVPVLVIEDAATVQPQPISFKRLVAQPRLRDLLHRRLGFEHVQLDGGVMPQMSLRALRVQPSAPAAEGPDPLVGQLRFNNLTWITRFGVPLEFDGNALFDAGWRPRTLEVVRPGVEPLTRLTLARQDQADRWQVQLLLGGGTAHGELALAENKDGSLQLSGQLEPRNVEVASALTAFKRRAALRGKASGRTTLSATGAGVGELARSLHTRTRFSVAGATVLNIDIDKTIRSFGKDRAGQTPLQSLTGQMDTQNTAGGMVVRYSGIQARGETFSASGEGTIANRQVDGEVKVDLVGGLIGVPLKVKGPLAAPQVSVPATALAGAAAGAVIGTAVLPGIGTAIGASVGASIGKLFGGDAKNEAPDKKGAGVK